MSLWALGKGIRMTALIWLLTTEILGPIGTVGAFSWFNAMSLLWVTLLELFIAIIYILKQKYS